jgi:D-alanyl-D-alanine carboxypeptidase (penicillin-binding protein 5/6)
MITTMFPYSPAGSAMSERQNSLRSKASIAALCAVVLGWSLLSAPPAGGEPNTDPYVPPSVTIEAPSTDDCAQRSQPPPAVDTSEDVPPGVPAPTPLPVPANPVGGGRLGECGLIVPDGAPALPSDISAGAWLLADLDTGEVLAAKDPHGRYRPASTLKLLTAQVMLKNLKDHTVVVDGTENDAGQDGTRAGMEAGGKYSVQQLLTYLIIISGNDAANALARVNGGYDKTITEMNATANALGALDTRAATVSGLDGPGQQTSAYDLALFAKADMATPTFPEIISSVDVRVPGAGNEGYIAANDNQLLYQYPGALGGKTGFTDDAGNTYVGMAGQNGRRLVVTMMHGSQQPRRQWMQGASLLDWGFALPATTPPVGKLVTSLAEATAVSAQPTLSTGAPASSPAAAQSSSAVSAGGTGGTGSRTSDEASAPASSNSNGPWTAIVLAGIGLLIVVIGILLLLRRRQLNKRPTFAGDAKPAADVSDTSSPAAEIPAQAPADSAAQAQEPTADEPPDAEPPDAEPPVAEPPVGEPPTAEPPVEPEK